MRWQALTQILPLDDVTTFLLVTAGDSVCANEICWTRFLNEWANNEFLQFSG